MTGFAERFEQQGLERGRVEGREEGRQAVARNLIRTTSMDDASIADCRGAKRYQ
ncbi:hypothetical protein [Alcanivorax sp. S71-1-4]|uniref:hypothetical protein n=1 Tax=Alcanivorax sp. S71-1-4 TaxID=1177159 RepID=UPI001915E9AD|nr:hypothetical protein [Alcanivorax sp. S71-1-4]